MKPANPYNYNLPVGPEMFFGRQQDVERVAHHLTATPGDSFALIGGRRMGKTSLLEALLKELEPHLEQSRGKPVAGANSTGSVLPLPIFMDFTGGGVDSVLAFFQTVLTQARLLLTGRPNLSIPDTPGLDDTVPPAPAFQGILESWGRAAMAQQGCRPRLVLLLDECEQIVERPWTPDLYGALRYLLVGRSTRSLLKVVMTGPHRFLTQVRQKGSPLRNVLTYHMLYALDEEAIHALITQPTGNVLPEETVQTVAIQSGGHPFLTQYLVHHLWESGLDNTTPETVQRIAADFAHRRSDFHDWTNSLGDSSLQVYEALAQAESALSEAQLRATLQPTPPDLSQALEALCYHGLIVRDADRGDYQFAGQMFRDWFLQHAPRPGQPDAPTISVVRDQLKAHFDHHTYLEELCQDLGLDTRTIRRETVADFIIDIVREAHRQGQLSQVQKWIEQRLTAPG